MAQVSPPFSPFYRQIKNLILQGLASGEWRPGEAIPSEAELAIRFNVSQGTVRKAIDEMAAENLVVRKQGKGTYVASHNDPRAFFRFLRVVPNEGGVSVPQSVPLECWRAKAGHASAPRNASAACRPTAGRQSSGQGQGAVRSSRWNASLTPMETSRSNGGA